MRKLVPGSVVIAILLATFFVASSQVGVAGADQTANEYKFTELPIALPAGYDNLPMKTVRQVNPAYAHISAWLSSIGAAIAINDLTGHGRADSMCVVDPRTDDVIVTYTPTAPEQDRFAPFVLDAAPLPMDAAMAPTTCTPGDFTGDGRMGILVTYFGRTPILFLPKSDATTVAMSSYVPTELIPSASLDGKYHGPRWNTSTVSVDDYAGHGHPDLIIGNYFPDSDVLDPHGQNNVVMNDSLSSADNSGGDKVLRWFSSTPGPKPSVSYVEDVDAIPYTASTGWTLAIASADLTGSGLHDAYLANDFGHDFLLHNVSAPDHIRFTVATGERTPVTPKSFVLGKDSFKGMGADFADLGHTGRFDIQVSNITAAWGLQESNFVWKNDAKDEADMKKKLESGDAPFTQEAEELGMAWSGWGWDVKAADFLNSGNLEVLRANGFVKGTNDRWNWLQEMAMANDNLLINPGVWPNVKPGDDVSGGDALAFYARGADGKGDGGKFVNVNSQLGIAVRIPTRGVAIGDTKGDGTLDFAVARQWGPPAFYRNDSKAMGDYLNLRLHRPASGGPAGAGTPAYGATVKVTTSDGRTQVSMLDGGSGHSGRRSFDVHFGLGADMGPASAQVRWRDEQGTTHQQDLTLSPGTHTLVLSSTAQEVPTR
jgi:hypothetical protein